MLRFLIFGIVSRQVASAASGRHLLQVGTGVGLGRQLEELLLVQLVDLRQLLLLLQDDVFKGLDLERRGEEEV